MEKTPTLVDVANLAGTSKSTAARVFSRNKSTNVKEETKIRVVEAAQRLGYEPNRQAASLRSKKTYLIGLCVHDITNPSSPSLIRGIQDELELRGYDLVVFNNDWDPIKEKRNLQAVTRNQFDGLILSSPSQDLSIDELPNIPTVLLTGDHKLARFLNTINTDTAGGVKEALNYLYSLGHRRIGLLLGGSVSQITNRSQAYYDFYHEAGLKVEENLIANVPFKVRASETFELAKELIRRIVRDTNKPTAIFASNDILGLATLQIAQSEGISIPEDLSVVGMDELFSAETASPPLTSVFKRRFEVGKRAASNLIEQIQFWSGSPSRPVPKHEVVKCSLIIRGSCAPISKNMTA